jgi:gluconolactonase
MLDGGESMTDAMTLDALVDPQAELEQLADGFWFTEGPTWNHPTQELVFSDIPGDKRWRWTEQDGLTQLMHPTFKGNGLVFEDDGSLLVCEQVTSCVIRVRPDGVRELVAYHLDGKYLNSPNDIVTRSDGGIYFTDPNYGRWAGPFGSGRENELDFQGVFRVERDGSGLRNLVDRAEFEQPNGLCFSPDEAILYVNDSPVGEIKAFDVAPDGSLSDPRLFFRGIGDGTIEGGTPDGMKCDEHGNVWCTGPGGVWVIDPAGRQIGLLEVPEVVGNLVWGGPDLRSLFLTASDKLYVVRTLVAAATLPNHGSAPRSPA